MEQRSVIYEEKDALALITLDREGSLNSFSEELVEELILSLEKASTKKEIRVVILTGAGRAFSSGGDLNTLDKFTTLAEKKSFIEKVGTIVKTIYHHQKPVIAMVNGVAAGAGFNLALSCDFVFAAKKARFIQSFLNVGLSPDCGGFYFLAKTVGLLRAKELMLTARPLPAMEAKELGIVNEVYEEDELQEKVFAFAQELAKKPPLALALTKEALNHASSSLDDTLTFEAFASSSLLETEDFKEGVKAFMEKRAPIFQGR